MDELAAYLDGSRHQSFMPYAIDDSFRKQISEGKMFGVLVVEKMLPDAGRPVPAAQHSSPVLGYLAGYSGQICGRSDWAGFVPAVFDYLQPDGYFKRQEAEITEMNDRLSLTFPEREGHGGSDGDPRPIFDKARQAHETEEAYIRRRQFENAELHRWKLRERARKEAVEAVRRERQEELEQLKTLRRKKSDALQTWLFRQFRMLNAKGEEKDLVEIFGSSPSEGLGESLPPSGAGECCEPRLLQYALAHGMRPLCMAMFWWGASPKEEVRHHLQTYPACNRKCKPVLRWMLQGMDVEPNPLEQDEALTLQTVYEDEAICVVCKPAGMLSVQGKSRRESVQSIMRRRYPDAESPLIVHRLDMATSGLMVIAKTMDAYKSLQQQFLHHEVRKRYVAVLSHDITNEEGTISLPLRPDLDDRPRQVVDEKYGKPAETYYKKVSARRIALYPHTGRTHQLRMHCAHRAGLDNPIKGDKLYGKQGDRLYLHAEHIVLRHPITGERMEFEAKAPF